MRYGKLLPIYIYIVTKFNNALSKYGDGNHEVNSNRGLDELLTTKYVYT